MQQTKQARLFRWCFYLLGCAVLACGIILNTKTGLGVSPLISVPYCISKITGANFSILTFVLYTIFCLLQFPIKGQDRRWSDLLQIPFSICFTLLLNMFSAGLPAITSTVGKAIGIVLAVTCTGIGVSLMVGMQLIPNPADALAGAIGTAIGRGLGFGKNLLDASCLLITLALALIFLSRLQANGYGITNIVGIGTVCAVIFTGRVVALFNHLFRAKLRRLSGFSD